MTEEIKMKQCPHCKEQMRADAGTCPHCGETLLGKWSLLLLLFFAFPLLCCLFFFILGMFSPN